MYRDMLVLAGVGQPCYLGARSDGQLVGLLPAFSFTSEAGTVFSSLPFFGPNAGVLCADDEKAPEIHRLLLGALLENAREHDAVCCSVYTPFLFDRFELYDSAMPDALVVNKFTQYLDLHATKWDSSIQYDLRKARRKGVEVTQEILPERIRGFYDIYEQNCRDYGIPLKPRACIEYLLGEPLRGRCTDAYFAVRDDELLAGLLVIRSPVTVSYYLPCATAEARTLQPGTLLVDEAVRRAREEGARFWNWESSPGRDTGVYHFKEKWGSREETYKMYVQRLRPPGFFEKLGREGIERHFPFYFVYPFDRLGA
ncbi:MAG: GNAT family N-acetyltransferase [Kiritimatiellae bacterium]|nr:GNAT family N-acetyltransferase [Kiritimatiellia bacterium]